MIEKEPSSSINSAVFWARISAGPGVVVIAASFALCIGLATVLANMLGNIFDFEQGLVTAIAIIGGIVAWMALLVVLAVREIHRKSAAAPSTELQG